MTKIAYDIMIAAHIIDFTQGKPQWRETRCEICLACLHRCPASAIEYGKSAGRGQRRVQDRAITLSHRQPVRIQSATIYLEALI